MQQEIEGRIHEVETLTKRFRREALQLCQNSKTPEAWRTAQHLLDQCWVDEESLSSNSPHNNVVVSIAYSCPQCGAVVYPGWEGTSLRVARLSLAKAARTRRRRLQRKQRRAFLSQQKQARDTNTTKHASKNESSAITALERTILLLRDDPDLVFDRHHVVIQCGRCQAKVRLKGLKREVPPTKQNIQRKQMSKGTRVGVNVKSDERKQPVGSHCDTSDPSSVDGPVDFLELPPAAPKKAAFMDTKARHGKARPSPLTLQNPKKGKKNKKGGGNNNNNNNKSQLFNFLSSLND